MKFNQSSIAIAVALLSSASAVNALNITPTQFPGAPVLYPLPVTAQSGPTGIKDIGKAVAPLPSHLVQFSIPAAGVGIPTLQNGDIIKMVVSGAKFDRVASAALDTSSNLAILSNGTLTAAGWTLDLATDTVLSGQIGNGAADASPANLPVDIFFSSRYDITGVPADTTVTLDVTVNRLVLGTLTAVHKYSTGVKVEELKVTPAVAKITTGTVTTEKAVVSESFLKFASGGTPTTALTINLSAGGPGSVAPGDYRAVLGATTGKLFVTLTGLPLNTTKVAWPMATTQVQADKTAPTTATPASDFYLPGDGTGYATIAAPAPLVDMVLTVDGVTAIIPTDVKLKAEYLKGSADILKDHVILAPTKIASISRDGSSFTVNSSNKDNVIKITDMSGNIVAGTGAISIMAYDKNGAAVAGTMAIPDLASSATVKIMVKDLKTAYPTSVRYDFSIESTSVIASNVKRVKNGAGQTIGINVEKYSPASINTL